MDTCNANQKKSLMNSLDQLNHRSEQLTDLARNSGFLLKKFTNPLPQPEPTLDTCDKRSESVAPPDLIDLFNSVSERMQRQIEIIGKNMESISQMVD